MTRERAAELLSDVTVLDDPEMAEAHRVAISALRQQEHFCEVTKKAEPLTNAQKIRAMSDEELVNLHYSGSAHCIASDPTVCDRHDFIGNLTPCEQCYLKWLQQPAEGDGNA